jgi:tripartite-type tricarboxylate transporter receptor subunit TctC
VELIAYVKARPRQVTSGFPNIGSPQHLAIRLFEKLAGVELVHVPYKNQPQILTDLIGGQIQMTVEFAATAAPHVRSGKLRALAIVGSRRKPALPGVPTAAEAGLPGFEINGWHGYLVPAGTPALIVAKLNKELSAALRSKDYLEAMHSMGSDVVGGAPEEFKAFIKLEQGRWAKIVAETGARLD